MKTRLALAAVACVGLATSGCLGLKPKPDLTRFYLLQPVKPAAAAVPAPAGTVVFVGPVEVPEYLAAPGLAIRQNESRVEYSSLHQWAEPLRDGVARALREALAARLGADAIPPAANRRPTGSYLDLQAALTRAELTPEGEAVLGLRWRLVLVPAGSVAAAKDVVLRKSFSAAPADRTEAVQALSEALDAIAEEIAAAARKGGG